MVLLLKVEVWMMAAWNLVQAGCILLLAGAAGEILP
jgi:hypothetical protein